jgi:hypothetical protein
VQPAWPAPETRTTTKAAAPLLAATERVCSICGAPAAGACVKCGAWYCVAHRGVEAMPDEPLSEDEPGPRICWNCRLSSNAKAVLFWVAVGTGCFVALIYFLSLWV